MKQTICNMKKAVQLFNMSFIDLIYKAHNVHRKNFSTLEVERCTLLSIKTGACPEDCAYCPQSGHYLTGIKKEKMLTVNHVIEKALLAKKNGASRFCMGAAWRSPPTKYFSTILEMIKAVKDLKMEACVTLGMLSHTQAKQLKAVGLDFYNHNLDTSPRFYKKIITTRTYQDRLNTIANVREAGIKVCCGGIIGMGETRADRVALLIQLASLNPHPESVPLNRLIPIKGTPLEQSSQIDNLEFIRNIAVARILMPTSTIRLSAGRENMSQEMQTLCFMAGANSIFIGDKLLTANNHDKNEDIKLLQRLGIKMKGNHLSCR